MTNTNITIDFDIDPMKKDDLIDLVMRNTDEYRRTHLVQIKRDEVLKIAAEILLGKDTEPVAGEAALDESETPVAPEKQEAATSEAGQTAPKAETPAHDAAT